VLLYLAHHGIPELITREKSNLIPRMPLPIRCHLNTEEQEVSKSVPELPHTNKSRHPYLLVASHAYRYSITIQKTKLGSGEWTGTT
jgi:hypothetical protein